MREFSDDPKHSEFRADLAKEGLDPGALGEATDVIHMASVLFAASSVDFYRENINITRGVADAVLKAPSVKRLIFTSSLAARGPGSCEEYVGDRSSGGGPVSDYGEAKAVCEDLLTARLRDEVQLTHFRAPVVISRHDHRLEFLLTALKVAPSFIAPHFPRRFSAIVVEDLAEALAAAVATQHALNGTYDLGHSKVVDVERLLGRRVGEPAGTLSHILNAAALGSSVWARMTGTAPMLTRDKLKEARQDSWCGYVEPFQAVTGWEPKTEPESFLREMLVKSSKR